MKHNDIQAYYMKRACKYEYIIFKYYYAVGKSQNKMIEKPHEFKHTHAHKYTNTYGI